MIRKRTIFIFFLIILLFGGFLFINSGKWDGASRFTLAVDADPLLIFSIEPESSQAILVAVPINTMLDVPFGYGNYRAGAVYPLGELDAKRGGGLLLSKSIEAAFGISVDAFWASKERLKFPIGENGRILDIKKSYFSILGFIPALNNYISISKAADAGINRADLFRLWNSIRKIRIDQITILDLTKMNVLSEEKQADGEVVERLDTDLLDRIFQNKFQNQKIRAENVSVEVVNATGGEKTAYQFSRILENYGANVVSKTTAVKQEKYNCAIYSSSKIYKSSIIINKLTQKYGCRIEETDQKDVAEIKIVLGETFIK